MSLHADINDMGVEEAEHWTVSYRFLLICRLAAVGAELLMIVVDADVPGISVAETENSTMSYCCLLILAGRRLGAELPREPGRRCARHERRGGLAPGARIAAPALPQVSNVIFCESRYVAIMLPARSTRNPRTCQEQHVHRCCGS